MRTETVSNLGGLPAIGPGGRPGGAQGKRDDQGRDDLPALFSPQVMDGLTTGTAFTSKQQPSGRLASAARPGCR
jgi:hypothetical protein